jgi:hypothetical protein
MRVRLAAAITPFRSTQQKSKARCKLAVCDATEQEQIQEEKESTKQCLAICAQASEKFSGLQQNVFEDISTSNATLRQLIPAKPVISKVLQEFHTNTTSDLEERLQPIDNRSLAVAGPLLPVWISDGLHQQTCCWWSQLLGRSLEPMGRAGQAFPSSPRYQPPWLAPKANIA